MIHLAEGGDEKAIEKGGSVDRKRKGLGQAQSLYKNQGGDDGVIDDFSVFPQAEKTFDVISDTEGYLNHLPAHEVGIISRDLGAGRVTMDDELDMAAGVYLHKSAAIT